MSIAGSFCKVPFRDPLSYLQVMRPITQLEVISGARICQSKMYSKTTVCMTFGIKS
jgi:hypothetical protein